MRAKVPLSEAFRMTAANTSGARMPASLLQMPTMLILRAALSRGPMIVTYGLAAVCRMASPVPMRKRPVRNSGKVRSRAAGTNRYMPRAMNRNPTMIPFLKPAFCSSFPAGMAMTKYAM